MLTVTDLRNNLPRAGKLEWIGLSPGRREPMTVVESAEVRVCTGLEGDHHARGGRGKRQVTIIQYEHLPVVAALCGLDEVTPQMLRRNVAVSGISVLALKDRRFRIGEVVLEGSGPCEPCSRMEWNLGPGGYNAMRGHGGITARVIEAGTIHIGDRVEALDPEAP